VQGAGGNRTELTLSAGGRVSHARLFRGAVSNADVSLEVDRGSLSTSFNGRFDGVDPAVAFNDSRLAASMTGSAEVSMTVRDLLTRSPSLADYTVVGTMALERSTIRGIDVTAGHVEASLRDETVSVAHLDVAGPTIEGTASGGTRFVAEGVTDVQYDITHADLARLEPLTGRTIAGQLSTHGRLTGSRDNLRVVGDAMVAQLDVYGVNALTLEAQYDVTIPGAFARTTARVTGTTSFLNMFGQLVPQVSGTVAVEGGQRAGFDLKLRLGSGREGALQGNVLVDANDRIVDIQDLAVMVGRSPWRLEPTGTPTRATWQDNGFAVDPVTFVGGVASDERIGVSGTWRRDGSGAFHVTARHVFLETLQGALERPTRYGGVLNLDAVVRGTGRAPIVTGYAVITDGRIDRVTYQRLEGQVTYADEIFGIDLRLDQSPGAQLTAVGRVPRALFDSSLPAQPIEVAIKSSPINLGLLEGATDAVRNVTGTAQINVNAVGSSLEPQFDGSVDIANAGFLVAATGSRYKNGRASLKFTHDLATVESFHVEDSGAHPFDVHGSLNMHQLRVGDVSIDAIAQGFEVIANEFGRVDVDAKLNLRGQFESPRVTGDLTIKGGEVKVDAILAQTLYRPYATEQVTITQGDIVSALNPWDRVGLDLTIHVPQTLKLTGSNIQISPDTPLGLGDINLRAGGDVYLYKDPARPLYTNGSLYRMSGTYRFQGRAFQIDEANSSINFQGDATNPELYVTVARVISAVETRVTVSGALKQPELRFASNPPLDDTDILSLIVFNASPNDLTTAQRQELAVRAGALAAGFLAAPLMSAIEREIGLDVLELEPGGDYGTGPKVTLGDEIAPGLIARFSREFGPEPYDEATIEYYLSRILRLRATLSDAQSLNARAPFRRIERAGIDLLLFFSF
jgi:autotransporter translocation and assembly factor TamB